MYLDAKTNIHTLIDVSESGDWFTWKISNKDKYKAFTLYEIHVNKQTSLMSIKIMNLN